MGLAILRIPVHPIPSFPALPREDTTHSWTKDDRVIKMEGQDCVTRTSNLLIHTIVTLNFLCMRVVLCLKYGEGEGVQVGRKMVNLLALVELLEL